MSTDELVEQLLDQVLADPAAQRDRRLARDLLLSSIELVAGAPATLDLKIAGAALAEMDDAFRMFAPFRGRQKVTIFGSARTRPDEPLYDAARRVAAALADEGWMCVTGAGPGIMQAGMEGAGRDMSIGVSIRLPFEQGANPVIAGDEKYVSMKYFFTRKLMLVKESQGFVCLPGGFGTLDETFELLTLVQTGKGLPVPIVFLDTDHDPYWEAVDQFVRQQLVARRLVAEHDPDLYLVTADVAAAVQEVVGFYRNYHSIRYVGDKLVLRLRQAPTPDQLDELNRRFSRLCSDGRIVSVPTSSIETREGDHVDLPRVGFTFGRHGYGDLRQLIDAVNSFVDG